MPTPMRVSYNSNYVYIKYQDDDTVAYTIEKNKFEEETGVTINNIDFPIPVYLINLSSEAMCADNPKSINATSNKTLKCGNIIDNFFLSLSSSIDNAILIVNFDEIEEVSENFCKHYLQYLLTTNNKVITINQDINVSNTFSEYVLSNIELQEL